MPSKDHRTTNDIGKPSTLTTLAEDIQHHAEVLRSYLANNDLPQPSFEADTPEDYPPNLPEKVQQSRLKLREAATAMTALAAGPKEDIMWLAWGYHDISTLMYINHFQVAEAIPLVGSIAFADVAETTKTNENQLKRILRYCMLNRLFSEPEPGRVAHTASSRQLVTSVEVKSWLGYRMEETAPAAFNIVAAAERWGPEAEEREETAFSLAHSDGALSRFDWLDLPENRGNQQRFATMMEVLQETEGWNLEHVVAGYAWGDLKAGSKVVDIGGSTGATAVALAKAFPHLRLIVEDLPSVISKSDIPDDVKDSITFQEYDFFEEVQPITDAAVYFMRFIPHDWTTKYAAKLLQNTARVMKSGQKLVIMDTVMPAPGELPRSMERRMRKMDMEMLGQFNSLERERSDWERVLKRADPRLEIRNISKPSRSVMSLIEVVIKSDA